MKIGSVYFEDTGYCGVFDNAFELIWSDNAPLFKRVARDTDKFEHCLDENNVLGSSEYVFKYSGRLYCAIIYNVKREFILCRIYPEIGSEKLLTELKNGAESISCGALNIMNLVGAVMNAVKNERTDDIPEYLKKQQEESEIIYTECLNITDKFIHKSAAKYVPIKVSVLETLTRIDNMTKNFDRRIKNTTCFKYPYVKIDYPTFERGIYNLAKLFFKYGRGDALIKINESDGTTLLVDFRFLRESYMGFDEQTPEKVGAESVFAALGGESEFTVTDDEVKFHGSLNIVSTFSHQKVAEQDSMGHSSRFICADDELTELKNRGKDKNRFFSSSVTPFEVPEAEDYGSIIFKSLTDFFD